MIQGRFPPNLSSVHPSVAHYDSCNGQSGTYLLCVSKQPSNLRDAKRCERCERCLCKDFPTGVKILVENVMKGDVKNVKSGNQKCQCL